MKDVLEIKLSRQIKLLEILKINENGFSIEELSDLLKSSKSTVLNEINFLNETYLDYLFVEKKGRHFSLAQITSEKILYVQSQILKQSKNIRLLTQLLMNPFNSIKFYAKKIGLSQSNTYKSIIKINKLLREYKIEIVTVNNLYFINSFSEKMFRDLFTLFWVETNHFNVKEHSPFEYEKIFLDTYLDSNLYDDIEITQRYYKAYIFISYMRESQGFFIKNIANNRDTDEEKMEVILSSMNYSPFVDNPFFDNRNFDRLKIYLQEHILKDKTRSVEPLFRIIRRIYENEISFQLPFMLFINPLSQFYSVLQQNQYYFQKITTIIKEISSIINMNIDKYKQLLAYVLVVHYPEAVKTNEQHIVYVLSTLSENHSTFLVNLLDNQNEVLYKLKRITNKNFHRFDQKQNLFITNDTHLTLPNQIIINDFPSEIEIVQIKEQIKAFLQAKTE